MSRTFKVPRKRDFVFKPAKIKPVDDTKQDKWLEEAIQSAARKKYKVAEVTYPEDPDDVVGIRVREMTEEERTVEDKRRTDFKARMDSRKAAKAASANVESNGEHAVSETPDVESEQAAS